MEIVMCVEALLLDNVKRQYDDLLNALMVSHSLAISAEQYNKIFDACFNLTDFICVTESTSEIYLSEDELELQSAQYVLQSISDLMDAIDDAESIAYQSIVLLIQQAKAEEGRLQNAMKVLTGFYASKYGLSDVLSQKPIYTNFMKLKGK
jgi:uncharacterized protein YhaN